MRMPTKGFSKLAEFLVVAICIVTFIIVALGSGIELLQLEAPGTRDFIEYWASGHQIIHRANPYDVSGLLQLERSAGFPAGRFPLVMWNPPFALPLVLPLGALGAETGFLLWELLLLASLIAAVKMIAAMHGRRKSPLNLLAYSFAPVLSCFISGQVTIFILLGVVLFLKLHRTRPFMAGASLWLCLLKPHLFLPFGVVLLLWIVVTRSYKILAGTACAVAAGSILASIMDPLVWIQYAQLMRDSKADRLSIPSLSTLLRHVVYPHSFWLQCLPACLACVWAVVYFLKRRKEWDWIKHGSVLLLVSVLVAPYTWFMDQAVAIPALLRGAYLTRSRTLIAVLALLSAIIEIGLIRNIPLLYSVLYVWTAPAWLVWYLLATRRKEDTAVRAFVDTTVGVLRPTVGE